MLMQRGLMLVVCAGAACSAARADMDTVFSADKLIAAPVPSGGFTGRPNTVVFGCAFPGNGGDFRGLTANCRLLGDDFMMSLGAGNLPPVTLNGAFFGVIGGNGSSDVTVRLKIYDDFTGFVVGTFPGGTVLQGTATWDLPAFSTPGYVTYYPTPIAFAPAGTTIVADDLAGFATVETLTLMTTTPHPLTTPVGRGQFASICNPGTSNANVWLDTSLPTSDGRVTSNAELANPTGTQFRAAYFGLQADLGCSAPPVSTAVGPLADGTTIRNGTVSATAATWYSFSLNGDATDAVRQFLNFDTEGSTADVAIALYGTSAADCGRLIGNIGTGSDDDSGSGTNAQLTYGAGRTAGTGDGRDYDGRDGEVTSGSYLLAVAPAGTSFGPGYSVSVPTGSLGGAFTVRMSTNTNGGTLPAHDVPDSDGAILTQDVGCLMGTSLIVGTTTAVLPYEVGWYTFAVPAIASPGTQYLDIDFSRTAVPADAVAYVFDCAGNVVASSDDGVPTIYFQPVFSFGQTTPARTQGTAPAGLYAGQDGALPSGQYYLGVGLFPVTSLAANDRFHIRSGRGSSLDINPDFYANTSGVCGSCAGGGACDDIDFNNDGVQPDSLDIDDFLSVFGGGPCSNDPNCADIDFNNDGVQPDSLDIDQFFTVFGGGTC